MYFIVYTKKRQTLYYKEPVFFISFGKAKNWLSALALAAGKT